MIVCMPLQNQALSGDNLDEVIAFIRESNPFAQRTWGWDTGRFMDWRYGANTSNDEETPGWFCEHCVVFRDGTLIKAVTVSEYGLQSACIITCDEDPDSIEEVLPWLMKHHAERGAGVILDISDSVDWLKAILSDHGFTREVEAGSEWEYDLSSIAGTSQVPEGFTIEHLADGRSDDYDGIAECIKRAFNSDHDTRSTLTSIESSPMFQPELSVFARSPDGRIAAYCRGSVDPTNGVCGIDPVCCHPDFQRMGLSKAVVQTCLRTQRDLGGRFSYIGSAPEPAPGTYLYRSLGPSNMDVFSSWKIDTPK
jgi:hypothetical protein